MRKFFRIVFSTDFLYIVLIAAEIAAIIFLCICVPAALPLAAAVAGVWLLTFLTAATILVRAGDRESKCAFFFVVCALPVVGAVIYFFMSANVRGRGKLHVEGERLSPLSRYAGATCGTAECGYDEAVYFKSGAECFDEMFSDISQAKVRVCAEFFIIARGEVFDGFLRAIARAAANGAKIEVLADGVGCAFKLRKRDIRAIEAAGAEVKIFGRISPLPRARLNFRDHRKIVTVDGERAYIGGINLADEYAGIKKPYGYWKDNAVRICGAAAAMFEGMFTAMWQGKHKMPLPEGGKFTCLPFCDAAGSKFAEGAFMQAIYAARERVHILTPYFCAGDALNDALADAAMRGVDVKVIIPHIPDKKYAFELSKATAAELAPYGVEFYEFTPGFMHAKAVICDGRAFLGSCNFDFRSTRTNYECGAAFTGYICDCAEQDFNACLCLSERMNEGRLSPAKRLSRLVIKLVAPLI